MYSKVKKNYWSYGCLGYKFGAKLLVWCFPASKVSILWVFCSAFMLCLFGFLYFSFLICNVFHCSWGKKIMNLLLKKK